MSVRFVDLTLLALFAVVWPLVSHFVTHPRFVAALRAGVPGTRARRYRRSIVLQWMFAALVVGWTLASGRPLAWLGIAAAWRAGAWVGVALAGAALGLMTLQHEAIRRRPEVRLKLRRRFARVVEMLPHDRYELRLFQVLSVTAGVCEEVLFRGFAVAVLGTLAPGGVAIAASALLFGFSHSYQGRRGIVTAAIVGLLMSALYAVSGSLWLAMVFHAATDLINGATGYLAIRAEPDGSSREAAA